MCEFLTNNNRITLLDLSGNHLGDHDAKQIASMLQVCILTHRMC